MNPSWMKVEAAESDADRDRNPTKTARLHRDTAKSWFFIDGTAYTDILHTYSMQVGVSISSVSISTCILSR